MSEKESYDAEREARREIAAHPQWPDRAEGVLSRFLSIIGHQTRGRQKTDGSIDPSPAGGGQGDTGT